VVWILFFWERLASGSFFPFQRQKRQPPTFVGFDGFGGPPRMLILSPPKNSGFLPEFFRLLVVCPDKPSTLFSREFAFLCC